MDGFVKTFFIAFFILVVMPIIAFFVIFPTSNKMELDLALGWFAMAAVAFGIPLALAVAFLRAAFKWAKSAFQRDPGKGL
jgi:hypothetical protein